MNKPTAEQFRECISAFYKKAEISADAGLRASNDNEQGIFGMAMKQVKFHIKGTSPLMMHNEQLADPLNEYSRKVSIYSSKKKKTMSDHEDMRRLEFEGGLYINASGPFIPSRQIIGVIRNGGRRSKSGKTVERAIRVLEDEIPLLFKGPKAISELYEQKFYDVRGVRIGGKTKVMRCRPIFPNWEAKFTILYDPNEINKDDIVHYLDEGGRYCAIGDNRPYYGTFEVAI